MRVWERVVPDGEVPVGVGHIAGLERIAVAEKNGCFALAGFDPGGETESTSGRPGNT
jgi:hypothetical protein